MGMIPARQQALMTSYGAAALCHAEGIRTISGDCSSSSQSAQRAKWSAVSGVLCSSELSFSPTGGARGMAG
jgi:hypothetical protein